MTQARPENPPLFVDLDGTLVQVDTLHETLKEILWSNPTSLPKLVFSLLGGKASFKSRASSIRLLDVTALPYHSGLLAYLVAEKKNGRHLVLATGADQKIAAAVASHLKIFDGIIASDGEMNQTGKNKLRAIRLRVKDAPFDYAGDSQTDFPIFLAARKCLLVNPSTTLLQMTKIRCTIERIFP